MALADATATRQTLRAAVTAVPLGDMVLTSTGAARWASNGTVERALMTVSRASGGVHYAAFRQDVAGDPQDVPTPIVAQMLANRPEAVAARCRRTAENLVDATMSAIGLSPDALDDPITRWTDADSATAAAAAAAVMMSPAHIAVGGASAAEAETTRHHLCGVDIVVATLNSLASRRMPAVDDMRGIASALSGADAMNLVRGGGRSRLWKAHLVDHAARATAVDAWDVGMAGLLGQTLRLCDAALGGGPTAATDAAAAARLFSLVKRSIIHSSRAHGRADDQDTWNPPTVSAECETCNSQMAGDRLMEADRADSATKAAAKTRMRIPIDAACFFSKVFDMHATEPATTLSGEVTDANASAVASAVATRTLFLLTTAMLHTTRKAGLALTSSFVAGNTPSAARAHLVAVTKNGGLAPPGTSDATREHIVAVATQAKALEKVLAWVSFLDPRRASAIAGVPDAGATLPRLSALMRPYIAEPKGLLLPNTQSVPLAATRLIGAAVRSLVVDGGNMPVTEPQAPTAVANAAPFLDALSGIVHVAVSGVVDVINDVVVQASTADSDSDSDEDDRTASLVHGREGLHAAAALAMSHVRRSTAEPLNVASVSMLLHPMDMRSSLWSGILM
jgi:hypothetical protein